MPTRPRRIAYFIIFAAQGNVERRFLLEVFSARLGVYVEGRGALTMVESVVGKIFCADTMMGSRSGSSSERGWRCKEEDGEDAGLLVRESAHASRRKR